MGATFCAHIQAVINHRGSYLLLAEGRSLRVTSWELLRSIRELGCAAWCAHQICPYLRSLLITQNHEEGKDEILRQHAGRRKEAIQKGAGACGVQWAGRQMRTKYKDTNMEMPQLNRLLTWAITVREETENSSMPVLHKWWNKEKFYLKSSPAAWGGMDKKKGKQFMYINGMEVTGFIFVPLQFLDSETLMLFSAFFLISIRKIINYVFCSLVTSKNFDIWNLRQWKEKEHHPL